MISPCFFASTAIKNCVADLADPLFSLIDGQTDRDLNKVKEKIKEIDGNFQTVFRSASTILEKEAEGEPKQILLNTIGSVQGLLDQINPDLSLIFSSEEKALEPILNASWILAGTLYHNIIEQILDLRTSFTNDDIEGFKKRCILVQKIPNIASSLENYLHNRIVCLNRVNSLSIEDNSTYQNLITNIQKIRSAVDSMLPSCEAIATGNMAPYNIACCEFGFNAIQDILQPYQSPASTEDFSRSSSGLKRSNRDSDSDDDMSGYSSSKTSRTE